MRTDPSRWWWRLRELLWISRGLGAWVAAGVWILWSSADPRDWLTWSPWLALVGGGGTLMEVALIGTWALERRGRVCVDCDTLMVRAPKSAGRGAARYRLAHRNS